MKKLHFRIHYTTSEYRFEITDTGDLPRGKHQLIIRDCINVQGRKNVKKSDDNKWVKFTVGDIVQSTARLNVEENPEWREEIDYATEKGMFNKRHIYSIILVSAIVIC